MLSKVVAVPTLKISETVSSGVLNCEARKGYKHFLTNFRQSPYADRKNEIRRQWLLLFMNTCT